MRIKFTILMVCLFTSTQIIGDTELISNKEFEQMMVLQQLQWKKTLSPKEVEFVIINLQSNKDTVVDEALKAVAIHQLTTTLPVLNKGIGRSDGYSRILGEQLKTTFETRKDAITVLREMAKKYEVDDYLPLRKTIQSTIVIDEVKKVREKLKSTVSLSDFSLTEYEKKLVNYNQMPDLVAIKEIVREISKANIAGDYQYRLVNILRTYDYELVSKQVFSELQSLNKRRLSGIRSTDTKYSNRLYLRYLQPYVGIAKNHNLEELKLTIGAIRTTDELTQSLINSIQESSKKENEEK